jgi:hypothetical protein
VSESVPTGRVEVANVAVLLRPLPGVSVALPRDVAPFIKTTDPVGAAEAPLTVAVSVVDWPYTEGFSEDVTAAVTDPLLTTWLNAGELAEA